MQEICSDIKKLDCAKNHLQSTITSLKRLQMLITAVSQLEVESIFIVLQPIISPKIFQLMASEMQYREVANLLDAVKQLMTHFEGYTSIPKIAEVKKTVDSIQHDLRRHVHHSFREIGQVSMDVCLLSYAVQTSVRLCVCLMVLISFTLFFLCAT